MGEQIQLGGICIEVVRKAIKNVHLSVYPPGGRVRISAPEHLSLETIRVFAIAKLDWIKQQQAKLRAQARETPREFLERESHYLWGQRYLLQVIEREEAPAVTLRGNKMVLQVRPQTDIAKRREILDSWYREQLKAALPSLISKWEPKLGVRVERFHVQRMKTRWGSCNPPKRSIRLNTELSRKPRECLEYLVVHEMMHLLEPTHNERFIALMDRFLPNWRHLRDVLNRLPVRHEA
ncbi:MAG: M48 family metallopeptidase [Calditrichaeota bacterium]|nr:M48 family metallopeptidase [Calditrichota bacterium]